MEPTRRPRLKICCIASRDEALLAVRHGASALGLVSAMPSGPGVISEESIGAIAAEVPPPVLSVLLTSRTDPASIVEQQRRLRVGALQICDRLPAGAHAVLRRELPGITLIQVIHVTGPESLEEAREVAGAVDALLLDSGNPRLPVKELGGTGRRHDWRLSRRIREAVPVPVFLAGGITPDRVPQAIGEVAPFALDVCTGVRTDGRLDEAKLEAFARAIG